MRTYTPALMAFSFFTVSIPASVPFGPANVYVFPADPITLFDCGPNTRATENALVLGLARHGLHVEQIGRVVISHGHPDHFDPASLLMIGPDPLVVVPRGMGRATGRIARRIREMSVNDRVEVGPIRITAVPARHGRWPLHRHARPLGYLVEGSTRIYFAGDTTIFPGMARLAGRVDIALLPVGRWGAPRGPDRLGPGTAVDAAVLVGARTAIPIHWGTFFVPGFRAGRWGWGSMDAGDAFAADALRRAPSLEVTVLRPGEAVELTR